LHPARGRRLIGPGGRGKGRQNERAQGEQA
jgi:hypothetical protein